MNREAFYQEIGGIDDDLIEAASEFHRGKQKIRTLYRMIGAAACFCLICGGILFGLQKDTLYINHVPAQPLTKTAIPSGENTVVIPMDVPELIDYYGLGKLPDSLGGKLTRMEPSDFAIYQDPAGNILYDTNSLYFSDGDGLLSITFSKTKELPNILDKDIKVSRIDGVSVTLASEGKAIYQAYFKLNDTSIRITSDGITEEDFICVVKEIVSFLK